MQFWKGELVPSACLDFVHCGGTKGRVLISQKVSPPESSQAAWKVYGMSLLGC